jgi:hypothetical protein
VSRTAVRAIARILPEGGPHQHEADDQLLIEYSLGTERILAIASAVRGFGICVYWDDVTNQHNDAVYDAALEVLELWRSASFYGLPIVAHEDAARQVAARLTAGVSA